MSERQRLHVCYILALAYAADGKFAQALRWLDMALELGVALDDLGALAELLYLHGVASSRLLRYQEAAADHWDCLALLRNRDSDPNPADLAFELDVVEQLAEFEFLLAHYDRSASLLESAARLVPAAPEQRTEAAGLEWVRAQLYRWRGEKELALRHAMAAADVYAAIGSPAASGRIQTVVADIALDLAETFPPLPAGPRLGGANSAFVTLAAPYVERALHLAHESQDMEGEGMALLARARYSRARQLNEDRLPAIEGVARTAQRLEDMALLAQAQTALGHELAARREGEASLVCYRQALDTLQGSDMPALGVWAHRAIAHADELRSDDV
jgi:tetratricopeptide (TPR) repeat protein